MRRSVATMFVIFCVLIIADGGSTSLLLWAGRIIVASLGVYLCARLATAAFFASKRHYDERKKP